MYRANPKSPIWEGKREQTERREKGEGKELGGGEGDQR
jgi:hypothetical protein